MNTCWLYKYKNVRWLFCSVPTLRVTRIFRCFLVSIKRFGLKHTELHLETRMYFFQRICANIQEVSFYYPANFYNLVVLKVFFLFTKYIIEKEPGNRQWHHHKENYHAFINGIDFVRKLLWKQDIGWKPLPLTRMARKVIRVNGIRLVL